MKEFIQYYPAAAPVIGDLYAKSMDWPGAEEVSQRLEFLLPPEIKAKKAADAAAKAGEPAPPPAEPPAPPPDPEKELRVQNEQLKLQEGQIKLQEMQIKLQQEQAKLEGLKLKNELMVTGSKEDLRKMLDEIEQEDAASAAAPEGGEGGPDAGSI
jgi:hypothetical protein